MESDYPIAPFVLKTFHMVTDPSTNAIISWGNANNSFVVFDPLDFSQRLLPTYFKHNNFSSFVRQLNTYGFRKVDPDKWEFANEWFLRGEVQLLKNIVRRKGHRSPTPSMLPKQEGDDGFEKSILSELAQLKHEQRDLEEEMEGINQRLQATEKKPQKMMAFLMKVAEDPNLISRMMLEKAAARQLKDKKRRLTICNSFSSSSPSSSTSSSSVLGEIAAPPTRIIKEEKETEGVSLQIERDLSQRHIDRDGDLFTLITAAAAPTTTITAFHASTNASRDIAISDETITIATPPPVESVSEFNYNNQMLFLSNWGRAESNTQPYYPFWGGY